MAKEVVFGIIGAGLMGREFASACARWCHLTEINAKPELVAVCDKNLLSYPIGIGLSFLPSFSAIRQTA